MSLIAELRLSSPEYALHETRAGAPEMRLEVEHQSRDVDGTTRLFFWASGAAFDRFEAALEEDPTVEVWRRLESTGSRRLYCVDLSPEATLATPARLAVGGSVLSVVGTAEGVDARLRFADRESMNEYVERCRALGLDVSLRRLYRGEGTDGSGEVLTSKQRAALSTARELGYFAVPREATLEDVADRLDVSTQAASERLRRATAQLVDAALDSTDRLGSADASPGDG